MYISFLCCWANWFRGNVEWKEWKMEAWWVVTLTEVSPFLLFITFEWQRGIWDTPGCSLYGSLITHFLCCRADGLRPIRERDGENFPVITKASLPPIGAIAVCWDLTLEHHWCGQFAQLLNQWELNQQRAEWQGSSWCQKIKAKKITSTMKQREITSKFCKNSTQISTVARSAL